MLETTIEKIGAFENKDVILKGWLYNKRSSGKIQFLQLRDGTGFIQCVVEKNIVGDELFNLCDSLPYESSIIVYGTVRKDSRAPLGYEILLKNLEVVQKAQPDYPISLKEHGIDFLMDYRHLWLRTPRQNAIMRIRHEIIKACHDFFNERGFIKLDAPIITPSICEGTSNLFEIDYFDQKAYLSQSGQLYAEAGAMALGKVYTLGPTFRAEKSKTRRHLNEFWMLEPEMAYTDQEENMKIQEELIEYIVTQVLQNRKIELKILNRDTSNLEKVKTPFPRITYDEAIEILKKAGHEIEWGDDFGAPHETYIASQFDKPVFVTKYPAKCKAFYMQPDPDRPEVVLCADLLAPEGYGEIIGGSQRIHDYDLLIKRIEEEKLPIEIFKWYLDLRKYGSVPHSGFGLGIERTVAWICGLEHIRETIPFARTLNRLTP